MRWNEFASSAPELSRRAAELLVARPAYLATVDGDAAPRVHPVAPVIGDDALYVFMEPTSPKGNDLRDRGGYALHNGVPDNDGTGGEVSLRGTAQIVSDPDRREVAARAAAYAPAERYVLFEFHVDDVRLTQYEGDTTLRQRWPER